MCVSPDQKYLSFGRTNVTIMSIPEFVVLKSFKHGGEGARSSNITNSIYMSGDYDGNISIYDLSSLEEEPVVISNHSE